MSFTCSWDLVQGSLDGVFGLVAGSDPIQAATFAAPSDDGSPCEFTLEVEDEEPVTTFDIVSNARLCELYTRRISQPDAKPSYAGSIASSPTSDGRRLLAVQLPKAPSNGPTQLILRMMHPIPDSQRFNLFSWLPATASEAAGCMPDSDGEKVDASEVATGISQADAVRQMLEALQPGRCSNGRSVSASFGGGLASLMASATEAHLPCRSLTPHSTAAQPDPSLARTSAQLLPQRSAHSQANSDSKKQEQQMRQQQQHTSSSKTAEKRQQPNPMQALMGSIGKAMLLKERQQEIAAEQEHSQVDSSVPRAVNHQPRSKSNTADPVANPYATELQGLMQQMLTNQKAAAEQQQATTTALQSLTATVLCMQARQEGLAASLADCLSMQETLNDALLAAAVSPPDS